jgi:hypothetical protein
VRWDFLEFPGLSLTVYCLHIITPISRPYWATRLRQSKEELYRLSPTGDLRFQYIAFEPETLTYSNLSVFFLRLLLVISLVASGIKFSPISRGQSPRLPWKIYPLRILNPTHGPTMHSTPLQNNNVSSLEATEFVWLGLKQCSYTRSQGQGWTQTKHSYWCSHWNQPQGLYTRSQGWKRKQGYNFTATDLVPRQKKDTLP